MHHRDQQVRQLIALAALGRPDSILGMAWADEAHARHTSDRRPARRRRGERR